MSWARIFTFGFPCLLPGPQCHPALGLALPMRCLSVWEGTWHQEKAQPSTVHPEACCLASGLCAERGGSHLRAQMDKAKSWGWGTERDGGRSHFILF